MAKFTLFRFKPYYDPATGKNAHLLYDRRYYDTEYATGEMLRILFKFRSFIAPESIVSLLQVFLLELEWRNCDCLHVRTAAGA